MPDSVINQIWIPRVPFFGKKLINGEMSSPPELLMRQRKGWRFIYRRPTDDEQREYTENEGW